MKIKTLLKHLFIPHEYNDYKPHFFRELSIALILFISIFLLGASMGSSFFINKTVLGANIAASVLIDLANESRLSYNEKPLVKNDKLIEAATLKGEDMSSKQYFSHDSPDGLTPWYWFKKVGYTFLYAGENLAINFTESVDINQAWLNSPSHRANLLDVKFNEIGIATVKGIYQNEPTIYVVQMFGTPAIIKSSPLASIINTDINEEKIITNIKTSTSSSVISLNKEGEVAGEKTETTTITDLIKPILETKDLTIVKNTSNEIALANTQTNKVEKYSTWKDKVIVNWPHIVDTIYKILVVVIAIALITKILIEFEKQHYKHTIYGLSLLIVITILIYINNNFF